MNLNFDIFEEFESNIFQRFSSIILFVYLYYSLSYYFITDDEINKPHIFFILILLILHLIHIICLNIMIKILNHIHKFEDRDKLYWTPFKSCQIRGFYVISTKGLRMVVKLNLNK